MGGVARCERGWRHRCGAVGAEQYLGGVVECRRLPDVRLVLGAGGWRPLLVIHRRHWVSTRALESSQGNDQGKGVWWGTVWNWSLLLPVKSIFQFRGQPNSKSAPRLTGKLRLSTCKRSK